MRLVKLKISILLFLAIVLQSITVEAARITGTIRDNKGEILPYVIILVEGTSNGTTTNGEGQYSIELQPGVYKLQFRLIGYKQFVEAVTVGNANLVKDITLAPESYVLKEVTIKADAEDPAYAIIRHAQERRKFYQDQVSAYTCDVYTKSTQLLISYPKKIFGQPVELGEFVDSATKIFYLSESVSKLNFRSPDEIKEEMISSKVSGSPRSYSFNQAADLLFTFYDNLVILNGLMPRGIVSPISSSAMLYYEFRLEGTFNENGVSVNKIKVIPRRRNDPVFTGDIYIVDDSWRIHSADLFITKDQQLEFVDTFRMRQTYIPVDSQTWMPFNNEFSFVFNFLGFHGKGLVTGSFSNYNLKPEFSPGFFDRQVMKVKTDANKKDSVYWSQTRPVPLTPDEKSDYHRRDSTRVIYESKHYRDSVDKIGNKFKLGNLLSGYDWENSYRKIGLSFSPLISNIHFNTVEGWNAGMEIQYRNNYGNEDRREFTVTPSMRYGFSNHHFNAHVESFYRYNPHMLASFRSEAGTDVVQFNRNEPISPFVNSMYSLLARKNYMKVYEKRYIRLGHKSELFNGFVFGINTEYGQRLPLSNTTDYSFASVTKRDYTSNNPVAPFSNSLNFPRNNSLIIEANLDIHFRQKYLDRPEGKFIVGSAFPSLEIHYRKGIHAIGSDVDYDYLDASVQDYLKLGLLGKFSYKVSAGKFISMKKLFFMDETHFNGNKTWFSMFRLSDFRNLDYYTNSTTNSFLQLHAEQNFGGFILNKIPLLRRLKLTEIAGFHYLAVMNQDPYAEFTFGIEKLGAFRAEAFTSFSNGKAGAIGFVFGIKQSIDTR